MAVWPGDAGSQSAQNALPRGLPPVCAGRREAVVSGGVTICRLLGMGTTPSPAWGALGPA